MMPIRIEHTPISAYGRAALEAGKSVVLREQREFDLRQQQVAMEQTARNRAFALQEAASQRAERTMMAGLEARGRVSPAGFEEMKERRRVTEQNMADWESLAGTMSEPEYRRGVISIRSGRTPQALQRERTAAAKPVGDVFRAGDKDALFNMAAEYAWDAPEAPGLEWGEPYRDQKNLIERYKQFLVDNNYPDLNAKDQRMLELQWEEAMSAEKKFRWSPASAEVRLAREEMQQEPGSDTKAELGTYLQQLQQDEGQRSVTEFRKKWTNPANRTLMLNMLRQRYGNVR